MFPGGSEITILHIIYSLYRGGAERLIEALLSTVGGERYRFVVASLTGGDDFVDRLRAAGATVYLLRKRGKLDPFLPHRIRGIVEKESIDICHFHNPSPSLWGTLSLKISRKSIPVVRTEHSPFDRSSLPLHLRALYPFIIRNTNRTICVSESVRESFARSFPRFENQFITIHNGIVTEDFDDSSDARAKGRRLRDSLGIPAGAPAIGTVGRLVPAKNHELLVRAFKLISASCPECHLLIAGRGPMKDTILKLSEKLSVGERVHILENTDVGSLYRAVDVFVLSSDTEGLSLALLEAMCAGVPAVSTDAGGALETIDDGVNGFVVPRGDENSLARKTLELLKDGELRLRLGAAGRATVKERFNIEKTGEAYKKLYEELTGDRV